MKESFIALGTNIEPREAHLKEALDRLAQHQDISIKSKSSIYETAPVGYINQEDFLNMVININTPLSPIDLLDVCQEIEGQLGRVRKFRNGPRTIDLDILVYSDENIQTERLTIPHPRMSERAFVLIPLFELAPYLSINTNDQQQSVKELKMSLKDKEIKDVKKWGKLV